MKYCNKVSYLILDLKASFLFLILTFSLLSASAGSDPVLDFAKQQIEQKQFKIALSTLNTYISSHADNKDGLYWKGFCYYKLGNYTAAMEYYFIVLKKDKKYIPALIDLANIYTDQKNFEEGLKYYTAAITLNDTDINVRNSRGMCFYYANKFEQAIKDFNYVIKLDSSNYIAYNNKGAAIYRNQNIAKASRVDLNLALTEFNNSLRINPTFEMAIRNRGIVQYYLDSLDKSYKDLLLATQLEPNDEDAHHYLGKVLVAQKNYVIAMQFFDNAIKLVNYDPVIFMDRGNCKIELDDYEGARADFYKVIKLNGDIAVAYYNMARCYAAEGDKNQTFFYLREANRTGLFKDSNYFSYINKDRYFAGWLKDKDFYDLIQWFKFGRK